MTSYPSTCNAEKIFVMIWWLNVHVSYGKSKTYKNLQDNYKHKKLSSRYNELKVTHPHSTYVSSQSIIVKDRRTKQIRKKELKRQRKELAHKLPNARSSWYFQVSKKLVQILITRFPVGQSIRMLNFIFVLGAAWARHPSLWLTSNVDAMHIPSL